MVVPIAASQMLGDVVRGTKDFQVPEFFNFADVVDEWAQKEKVKFITIHMFGFVRVCS